MAPKREPKISPVSSAFILPGHSRLRVHVGDTLIGEMPLRSITGLEKPTFPLRPGLVAPGVSRICIEADLAHRLYCRAPPAYDLWTSGDLANSGVPLAAEMIGAGPTALLSAANVARLAREPILIRGVETDLAASPVAREVGRQLSEALGGGLTSGARARMA